MKLFVFLPQFAFVSKIQSISFFDFFVWNEERTLNKNNIYRKQKNFIYFKHHFVDDMVFPSLSIDLLGIVNVLVIMIKIVNAF